MAVGTYTGYIGKYTGSRSTIMADSVTGSPSTTNGAFADPLPPEIHQTNIMAAPAEGDDSQFGFEWYWDAALGFSYTMPLVWRWSRWSTSNPGSADVAADLRSHLPFTDTAWWQVELFTDTTEANLIFQQRVDVSLTINTIERLTPPTANNLDRVTDVTYSETITTSVVAGQDWADIDHSDYLDNGWTQEGDGEVGAITATPSNQAQGTWTKTFRSAPYRMYVPHGAFMKVTYMPQTYGNPFGQVPGGIQAGDSLFQINVFSTGSPFADRYGRWFVEWTYRPSPRQFGLDVEDHVSLWATESTALEIETGSDPTAFEIPSVNLWRDTSSIFTAELAAQNSDGFRSKLYVDDLADLGILYQQFSTGTWYLSKSEDGGRSITSGIEVWDSSYTHACIQWLPGGEVISVAVKKNRYPFQYWIKRSVDRGVTWGGESEITGLDANPTHPSPELLKYSNNDLQLTNGYAIIATTEDNGRTWTDEGPYEIWLEDDYFPPSTIVLRDGQLFSMALGRNSKTVRYSRYNGTTWDVLEDYAGQITGEPDLDNVDHAVMAVVEAATGFIYPTLFYLNRGSSTTIMDLQPSDSWGRTLADAPLNV